MKGSIIKCKVCNNEKFVLRLVNVDNIKSIVAHCSCGRADEYRGFDDAINLAPEYE
jgi:hypothetical protein